MQKYFTYNFKIVSQNVDFWFSKIILMILQSFDLEICGKWGEQTWGQLILSNRLLFKLHFVISLYFSCVFGGGLWLNMCAGMW